MTSSPLGLGSFLEREFGPAPGARGASHSSSKTSEPPKQYDTDAAIEFLMDLDHDGRHDLAAIDPESGKIECATFFPKDREKMRAWIEARQGKKNLYFSVNRAPDDAPRNVRLSQKDIGYIRAIPADIDVPKKEGGDPSGQRFHDLRAKLLKEVAPKLAQLECPPSLVVDSGGGLQLYWKLRPAIPATPENIALVKGIGRTINGRLKNEFSDFKFDNVADPPRLLRLPGTITFQMRASVRKEDHRRPQRPWSNIALRRPTRLTSSRNGHRQRGRRGPARLKKNCPRSTWP